MGEGSRGELDRRQVATLRRVMWLEIVSGATVRLRCARNSHVRTSEMSSVVLGLPLSISRLDLYFSNCGFSFFG